MHPDEIKILNVLELAHEKCYDIKRKQFYGCFMPRKDTAVMKKRCFCLLLAAAMLITVFPLAAHALEGTRIADIPVTVTAPTLGKTTETAPAASVPADAGCTVTETLWVDEDYKELTVPVTFEADRTYTMEIVIDTEEGYYCTQTGGSHIGTTVTVSGGSLSSSWIVNMSDAQGNPHSTVYVIVAVQAQPAQIAQISLNVTPPTAGRGSTNAKSMIAVTGDGIADYYASWKTFTGYSTNEPTEIDFAEGRTYYGVITLYAAEGYTFKKGFSHDLDIDACDYYFGGEVSVTGGELYKNKANVRSVSDPEYLTIWITVTAGEAAVKLGDVDFDGNITASDARLALRRAVDLEDYAPGSREYIACDVDVDRTVTAGDARMILRAAVGLEAPDSWGK